MPYTSAEIDRIAQYLANLHITEWHQGSGRVEPIMDLDEFISVMFRDWSDPYPTADEANAIHRRYIDLIDAGNESASQ